MPASPGHSGDDEPLWAWRERNYAAFRDRLPETDLDLPELVARLAAAGAGIGVANLDGNTTANLGNVVGLGTAGTVQSVDVRATSNVDASSLAISVQGGGIALSAAVAIVNVTGTTSATAGWW